MNLHEIATNRPPAIEVARFMLAHLIEQGRPALAAAYDLEPDDLSCAYRGDDGTSCAVGCLLTDEDMQLVHEGSAAGDVLDVLGLDEQLADYLPLLRATQKLHDSYADMHQTHTARREDGSAIISITTLQTQLEDLRVLDDNIPEELVTAVKELQV